MSNPYYCGCGEGGDNDNNVDEACLDRLAWFRDLPDHSLYNDTETGPYGGMLLINFNATGIAYQRELTTDEAKNIRKNSILTFSAYFASAARERSGLAFNPIKMEMIIQFLKDGKSESEWENVATIKSESLAKSSESRAPADKSVLGARRTARSRLSSMVSTLMILSALLMSRLSSCENPVSALLQLKIAETARHKINSFFIYFL